MSADGLRIAVRSGNGLVARLGSGLLVVLPDGSEGGAQALVDGVRTACAGQATPGLALRGILADRLSKVDPDNLPSFAALAPTPKGWAAVLRGEVEVGIRDGSGERWLRGYDSTNWALHLLTGDFSLLTIGRQGVEPAAVDTRFHLEQGVVPGSGVVLWLGRDVAVTNEQPDTLPDSPSEVVSLLHAVAQGSAVPLPVLIAGDVAGPGDGPAVDGIRCERGHFNHPFALRCATCGVSSVSGRRMTVAGPRPSLGVMVLESGATFALDADYLVGRDPRAAVLRSPRPLRPLRLEDSLRSVSRVHAEIRLDGWQVTAIDRESANGTFMLPPDQRRWRRLAPSSPASLVTGTRIAFGRRVMTYVTAHWT